MRRLATGAPGLFVVALLLRTATALPFRQPGYMDAYYYYNVAERLYRGLGFTDPYLWNFLDNPAGIPHPACLYWMPLSSILIYPFFLLFGPSFRAAQVPFVLLSALLPLLAYRLALDLGGRPRQAWLAAGLMLLSGFYAPYWVSPDNFAPFAIAAGLTLYCAGRGLKSGGWIWFAAAGVLSGLAHLTRADGILLPAVVVVSAATHAVRRKDGAPTRILTGVGLALVAYAAVMAPWWYRNLQVIGVPLSAAGTQTLFLRGYDELFSYGRSPDAASFLDWGWQAILRSKLEGIGFAALNLVAVNWMVFLAPLVLWGFWALRRRLEWLPAATYALVLYFVMTIGFTYPGIRGGLFHSSAALLPWFCVAAVFGLEHFVYFVAQRRRSWEPRRALVVFGVGLLFLALVVSLVPYLRATGGIQGPGWNGRDAAYDEVERLLVSLGDPGDRLMVNNAPAYWYHAGRECMSIPNEPPETALDAADRYNARYLLLEPDHPAPMNPLYVGDQFPSGFRLIDDFGPTTSRMRLFRLEVQGR